jgi:hypothetical protein
MPKQIILYNLKESVTDEEYRQFCWEYKGPFIAGLPGCARFQLVKMPAAMAGSGLERKPPAPGPAPFRYLGIVDIADGAAWEKARSSREPRGVPATLDEQGGRLLHSARRGRLAGRVDAHGPAAGEPFARAQAGHGRWAGLRPDPLRRTAGGAHAWSNAPREETDAPEGPVDRGAERDP